MVLYAKAAALPSARATAAVVSHGRPLTAPSPSSAPYSSLHHAQESDATGRRRCTVAHWSLPTVDAVAPDERLVDVRRVVSDMTLLVDELDVSDDETTYAGAGTSGTAATDFHDGGDDAFGNRFFSRRERERQRHQMQIVTDVVNAHAQTHEEALQLLESVKPETAHELDRVLDDLEAASVHTSRVADFQVQATVQATVQAAMG